MQCMVCQLILARTCLPNHPNLPPTNRKTMTKKLQATPVTPARREKGGFCSPKLRHTNWSDDSGNRDTFRHPRENTLLTWSVWHRLRWKSGFRTIAIKWRELGRRKGWRWSTSLPHGVWLYLSWSRTVSLATPIKLRTWLFRLGSLSQHTVPIPSSICNIMRITVLQQCHTFPQRITWCSIGLGELLRQQGACVKEKIRRKRKYLQFEVWKISATLFKSWYLRNVYRMFVVKIGSSLSLRMSILV